MEDVSLIVNIIEKAGMLGLLVLGVWHFKEKTQKLEDKYDAQFKEMRAEHLSERNEARRLVYEALEKLTKSSADCHSKCLGLKSDMDKIHDFHIHLGYKLHSYGTVLNQIATKLDLKNSTNSSYEYGAKSGNHLSKPPLKREQTNIIDWAGGE